MLLLTQVIRYVLFFFFHFRFEKPNFAKWTASSTNSFSVTLLTTAFFLLIFHGGKYLTDCTLDECDTRYSMQCGTTNNMHVATCVGCINETSSASPLHIYASTLLASFACALTFLL